MGHREIIPRNGWMTCPIAWNLQVQDLLRSCSDLIYKWGTKIVVPVIATRVTCPVVCNSTQLNSTTLHDARIHDIHRLACVIMVLADVLVPNLIGTRASAATIIGANSTVMWIIPCKSNHLTANKPCSKERSCISNICLPLVGMFVGAPMCSHGSYQTDWQIHREKNISKADGRDTTSISGNISQIIYDEIMACSYGYFIK